jgi:PIN domain nuclease of toxin-antitoxin system
MILLDTHVLILLVRQPEKLSKAAAREILKAERSDGMAIASITLWELAQLIEGGRLRTTSSTEVFLRDLHERPGLRTLDLSPDIATLATRFPSDFPKDPADRIIAATARAHGLRLVTKDERIRECALLQTIW